MSEFSNIREILGHLIGQELVDITQHDQEEWEKERVSYVELLFARGDNLRFYVLDAELYAPIPGPFRYSDPNDDQDDDDETTLVDLS